MLKPCVWVKFVVVCIEGAGETVGCAWLWWKSVDNAKEIQQETVMGTLLVGNTSTCMADTAISCRALERVG